MFLFIAVGLVVAILCCVFSRFLREDPKSLNNWEDESSVRRRGRASVNSYLDDEIFP